MQSREEKFTDSFNRTIKYFIILCAPTRELIGQMMSEDRAGSDELNDSDDEITTPPVMFQPSYLPSIEEQEFRIFVKLMLELKAIVLEEYKKAASQNDNTTLDYLDNFANVMADTLALVKTESPTPRQKHQALEGLIIAACPSSNFSKKIAAPVVSAVAGFVGGILGFINGTFLQSLSFCILGIQMGARALVDYQNVNLTKLAAQVPFAGTAIGAAVLVSGYRQAVETKKSFYSLSHASLFTESSVVKKMRALISSRSIRQMLGRQVIGQKVQKALDNQRQEEKAIFQIIADYADPSDKPATPAPRR